MRLRLALPLLVAVCPSLALSETLPPGSEIIQTGEAKHYFAVLPGYFGADGDRGGTHRGVTGSLVYGYRFTPHWSIEGNLAVSTIETGDNKGTDFYQEGATVDLVYALRDRSQSWTPYALFGIGGVFNDVIPDSEDKGSFIANAGLGAVTAPLTSLGFKLRAEGRYQHDTYRDGFNDYKVLAGLEFPFGKRTIVMAPLAPPKIEVREVVKEVVVPKPFVDSDKDTIPDERDKCPDTPAGLKVDADGCVIEGQALELRGVTFAFNKAELQLNAQTVLDYVTKGMKGQPSMTVEIAGYTDSVGSAGYNLKLSQRRAEAVRQYLLGQGIEPARLTAKGYGKADPAVTPEKSDLDRERNRRVMFRVLGR